MDRQKRNSRPIKEAYFVRVAVDGERALFCDATAYIGKPLPYAKPQATCAMRVEAGAVMFSLLHLPRKSASDFAARPVKIPRAPFTKMNATLKALGAENVLSPGVLVVELDQGEAGISTYRYAASFDENNVGTLEVIDGFGVGTDANEDPTFDLPDRSVEMRVYLMSERVKRPIGVNFVGHIGKPRTPETVGRSAAMILNSISGLNEFRTLSGIEAMKVPAPPTKWGSRPTVRRAEERVAIQLPLQMFTAEMAPVAAFDLGVEIDLETSNQATGRLLFHLTPRDDLAEVFASYKRIVDEALGDHLRRTLGDELELAVFDVVLGEVSASTVESLTAAMNQLTALDVTTEQFRFHEAAVTPEVAPEVVADAPEAAPAVELEVEPEVAPEAAPEASTSPKPFG